MDRMIEYCLHNANPSIVYRIRKDILQDISKEEENRLQEKIMSEKIIISILDCQKENGWLGNGFHGSNKNAGQFTNMEAGVKYLAEKGVKQDSDVLKRAMTAFKELPNTKGKTLVADVSSCFLSEPVDVTKYGVIYGGVQKNIGPAGVVIVIIREDLITEDVLPGTPTMLKYKTHADADSLYNTPPAYGIYICGKVFKWLKKMGGLSVIKERNEKKAKLLYDYLDESKLFKGTVEKKDRSLMNVPFVTGSDELDAKFVKEAKAAGFENLKGHRTVGGMRASIYNAMPLEGVEALVAFMKKFEEENL